MSNQAETDLEVLKVVVNKIDESLLKMTEVSNNLGKIIAVHEQRIDSLEKSHDDHVDESRILHKRITELFGEMGDKLHAMEDRLEIKFQKQAIAAKEQHGEIQKEIQDDIDEISRRLQRLENWRWWMMGVGASVGVIVGVILPKLI